MAVLALAAVRLVDSVQRTVAAEQVRSLAAVSVEAAAVSHALHRERIEAARLLLNPGAELEVGPFSTHASRTDLAIARYQEVSADLTRVPEASQQRLAAIDAHLAELAQIRQAVLDDPPITAAAVVLRYGLMLKDVLAFLETVVQAADDPALVDETRAMAAMSSAKLHASEAEAITIVGLADGQLSSTELTSFLATQTGLQESFETFDQTATPDQRVLASRAITGGNVVLADRTASGLLQSAGGRAGISQDAATTSYFGLVTAARWVEERILADLLATTTEARDAVLQQVVIETVAVVLALAIALTVTVLLARMLARSLGQLRDNALAVAERELPETVARLSDPATLGENTPAQLAAQVREPIQLRSRDEIGEVAQAFNVVHRAAVRVAAEQAALRTSVSAMFLNLARRSQLLVDRMISQLDEIERHEEDPKRLSRMFSLDHLATRMRRNDENLLTLAGADTAPPRGDDALVADVLRAAQSEVEHYDRIEFGTVDTDVSVVAAAVNDAVRLVAELYDNATRFSPPDTPVVCEARRLGDQVIVQIEDRGVGMPDDQVQRINAWLASPPDLEVTTFRKMGLAVVARLANRHGIRVELRCDPNLGTIAYVALPRAILVLPASRMRYTEIPSQRQVTSGFPQAELPAGPPPAPAAPPVPAAATTPAPAPAAPPGQLPRRSPAVVSHSANRRDAQDGYAGMSNADRYSSGASAAGIPSSHAASSPPDATTYRTGGGTAVGNGTTTGAGNGTPSGAEMPVAGRPLYELTTRPAPAAAAPTGIPEANATVELPIFKEMEAVWFRNHGPLDLERAPQAPRAGGYPTAEAASSPAPEPTRAAPAGYGQPAYGTASQGSPAYADHGTAGHRPAEYAPAGAGSTAPGYGHSRYDEPTSGSGDWRTAADTGWQAAAAAADPQAGGATRSGLPKRVPQAQLVPGSVEVPTAGAAQRRSPEEVRGLLAAYHRGVQRGRESGGTR